MQRAAEEASPFPATALPEIISLEPTASESVSAPNGVGPTSSSGAYDLVESGRRIARLAGDLEVCDLVGIGGMGTVYRAIQTDIGRQVALKVVRTERLSPDEVERFRREARLLGRLHSLKIATVYRAGVVEMDGHQHPYIVMEYVRGRSITKWARECRAPLAMRLRQLRRVAEAIHVAHANRIVHLDIKPANVLIRYKTGRPKVVDFGLACSLWDTSRMVGRLAGTIPYMSPEQVEGTGRIGVCTDVHALGLLGYELIAGRLPWAIAIHQNDPRAIAEVVLRGERVSLRDAVSGVPAEIARVIHRACHPDPDKRYRSAGDFARDLRCLSSRKCLSSERRRTRSKSRRRSSLARAAARAAALAAAFSLGALAVIAPKIAVDARPFLDRNASWLAPPLTSVVPHALPSMAEPFVRPLLNYARGRNSAADDVHTRQ